MVWSCWWHRLFVWAIDGSCTLWYWRFYSPFRNVCRGLHHNIPLPSIRRLLKPYCWEKQFWRWRKGVSEAIPYFKKPQVHIWSTFPVVRSDECALLSSKFVRIPIVLWINTFRSWDSLWNSFIFVYMHLPIHLHLVQKNAEERYNFVWIHPHSYFIFDDRRQQSSTYPCNLRICIHWFNFIGSVCVNDFNPCPTRNSRRFWIR